MSDPKIMKNMKKKNYKIAIVGLGASGSVIARLFQKDESISQITCFVRSVKKAREFLPDGTKKIILRQMDILKERRRFVREIAVSDLIINAASSLINLQIMEAARRAGVDYLDLASGHVYPLKAEQLDYDKKFAKRNLKGLICVGVAPGISNLLISDLAGDFDSVDTVKLRLVEHVVSQDIISSWSPELAIEELMEDVPVYKNGRFIMKKPFSEEEAYDYPPPFGKVAATLISQDEQLTIPLFIKIRNIDVKSGGGDVEPMKLLYHLGLLSKKTISAGGKKIKPLDLLKKIIPPTPSPAEMKSMIGKGRIQEARFGIAVEMTGRKSGRRLAKKSWIVCPSVFKINDLMPGATYISYPTGLAVYLFAKKLRDVEFAGVIPPEGLEAGIRSSVLSAFLKISGSRMGKKKL